jgi:hypothetical protein
MKKIISLFAVLAAIVVMPISAHATGQFNTDPSDLPTIMVTNVTNNPSCQSQPGAGCWSRSISAKPGDVIGVQVYFHNSTPYLAEETTLSVTPESTSAVSSVKFSGGVASITVGRATGSATVTINGSAQTVTYIPGSIRLYKHGDTTPHQMSGSEALFGPSGLNIGDVSPGWNNQGTLTVQFKVGNNVTNTYQCSDGIDNDGDGLIDYPNDPGCSSRTDNDEYNSTQHDLCSIDSFSASDTRIDRGDSSRLSWNTSNCTNVSITDIGRVSSDGSQTVYPNRSMTYTITASGPYNTDTDQVTIRVEDTNDDTCSIDDFYASRTSIDRGDSTVLRWETDGSVDSVSLSGFGSVSNDGSKTVYPTSTTSYRLNVRCDNGDSDDATVTIYVDNNNTTVGNAPQAITTAATILSSTQARLNGIAVPNSNVTTYAWFDWGPTQSLEYHSSKQVINSSASTYFNDVAGGLTPGHTYYYRAAAQNQYGTTYGTIVPFQTQASSVATTTTVVKYVPQAVSTSTSIVAKSAPSLLELTVTSNYDHMCVGGIVDYQVSFRNVSTSLTLQNAVVRITLPPEVDYATSSQGTFNPLDRTLTVVLGNVPPQATGSIQLRGVVNNTAVVGKIAATTATVVYTNPSTHAQEDAIAYSIVTITNECPSLLGASVFGFSFLPHTLLGWLALILVILALIVLARQIGKKNQVA